ncbi:MAG: S8 family serine peptidase [Steroidobacteraceae bacterium]
MNHRLIIRMIAFGCAALSQAAAAQINLPPVRLPSLPVPGLAAPLAAGLGAPLEQRTNELLTARRARLDALVRDNRQSIEADPNGDPILRAQLIGLDLSPAALEQIATAGFMLISERPLAGLDTTVQVLRVPAGMSTRRALRALRKLQPEAQFDYDHLYEGSGSQPAADPPIGRDLSVAQAGPAAAAPSGPRVGLIDSGLEAMHAVFHAATIERWGCDQHPAPSAHGTAVASLLIGDAPPFHGAAPGAQLFAADVYCNQPSGGSVDTIVAAFGWLQANHVPVINISLVGPDNAVLRQVVARMIARGHIIVAAVGNDGPAAPPMYPAAFPDVVGVTAVDAHQHVLIEAGRGPQVQFAAPGADMLAASAPEGFSSVRGTSYAAPLVAGLLVPRLAEPDRGAARAAIESLEREAAHPGGRGPDPTYGYGLVGQSLRIAPDIMHLPPAH